MKALDCPSLDHIRPQCGPDPIIGRAVLVIPYSGMLQASSLMPCASLADASSVSHARDMMYADIA